MSKTNITFNLSIVSEAALPLWRQGQEVMAWREIAGSSWAANPPSVITTVASGGIHGMLNAWCGLSIDTRSSRVWSVANGGHSDTVNNNVTYFDLLLDNPTWIEVLPSSPNEACTFYSRRYTDGRPASTHSYYSQIFVERRNRAMRFGLGAVSSSGGNFPVIDAFDCTVPLGTDGWDPEGTYPDITTQWAPDIPTCKDPITEDVYSFWLNYSVWKWTEATNTMSRADAPANLPNSVHAPAVMHPVSREIFLVSNSVCHTFSPATGLFTARTLTGPYVTQATYYNQAMIYEPVLDKYLIRGSAAGSAIYTVDPYTWETGLLPVNGGSAISGLIVMDNGPYTKMLYVPALGGIVYIPHYASNAWFLRTH